MFQPTEPRPIRSTVCGAVPECRDSQNGLSAARFSCSRLAKNPDNSSLTQSTPEGFCERILCRDSEAASLHTMRRANGGHMVASGRGGTAWPFLIGHFHLRAPIFLLDFN